MSVHPSALPGNLRAFAATVFPVQPAVLPPEALSNLIEFPKQISLARILQREATALVRGLLYPGELAVLYGDSGAGKSFVGLDVAFHIALERTWNGLKVTKAPVLYVALEGIDGFDKRTLAITQALGDPGKFFARLNVPVSLVRGVEGARGAGIIIAAAEELARQAGQPVGLIEIDTKARATAGDNENDAADVMAFVEHRAGAIAKATKAAVLVMHHPNGAGNMRGSSALYAACETVVRLEREGARRRCIAEKVKDGREGPLFDFVLEQVPLRMPDGAVATTDDGDPVTSCIVRSSAPTAKAAMVKQIPRPERAFRAAFDAIKGTATGVAVPDGATGELAELGRVKTEFTARYITGEDESKAKEAKARAWRRLIAKLPLDFRTGEADGREFVWKLAT